MKKITIGKRKIGESYPTFIIAEVGSNHNRDLKQAKKLIEIAAEAEADAVKFQTYSAETMYSKKTVTPDYLEGKMDQKSQKFLVSDRPTQGYLCKENQIAQNPLKKRVFLVF